MEGVEAGEAEGWGDQTVQGLVGHRMTGRFAVIRTDWGVGAGE